MAQRLADREMVAPRLLQFEADQRSTAGDQETSRTRGRHPRPTRTRVDPGAVLDLAVSTGLTAYDAPYLWLARHLAADLVTSTPTSRLRRQQLAECTVSNSSDPIGS